ncbi:hotdog fold thioesterase [Alginatibacterium sediminis]|uniref:Hotdog fold thioesterase n=1 Tax=Alginatibacterium sediminis TaxID=2164068 RepID=A0A420EG85_9ALTE|nr:hotdog fold thioesterase [Alginatibacterium sediminis]RKF19722.1 hotdog fold thioesterase [Alginatibacterium sediminis]
MSQSIWQQEFDLERLNAMNEGNLAGFWDLEFTEIGKDYLKAQFPVTDKVRQPMGLLHGGASAAVAETIGSCAAFMCAPKGSMVLGVEINANHLSAVRHGHVDVIARPLKLGNSLQVWQINLEHANKLVCSSRLTVMVKAAKT